ncbi:MAG: dihydrofolate reductase, partial [Christensenellales bacterium]
LLFHLKEDMSFFKKMTLGKVIVMGSNTLMSLPGCKPLKNRINIVLFPGGEKRQDCIVVDSLDELIEELKKYDSDDIFIVGGAMFYKTMLPYCDTAYITKVDADGGATHFFENLDQKEEWELVEESDEILDNGYKIRFTTYKNNWVKQYKQTEDS